MIELWWTSWPKIAIPTVPDDLSINLYLASLNEKHVMSPPYCAWGFSSWTGLRREFPWNVRTPGMAHAPGKVANGGTSYDYQQPPMEEQQESDSGMTFHVWTSSTVRQPCLIDRRLPLFEDSPLTYIVVITCLNLYDCIILNDTIYITLSHFDYFVVHVGSWRYRWSSNPVDILDQLF